MKYIYTFEKHAKEHNKTLDSYVIEKKIELGTWVKPRKKIYLDTKFWPLLRDAHLGREKAKGLVDLLNLMREGMTRGLLICPISSDIFEEVIKQTDEVTLKATASLIDELSAGVSLVSQDERWKTEVLHFVQSCMLPKTSLYDVEDLVWTKIAYTSGMQKPHNPSFSREHNRLIQKAILDHIWNISLFEMIGLIGSEKLSHYPHVPDFSDLMNQEKEAYHAESADLGKIFLTELEYILKHEERTFDDMFAYLFEKKYGRKPKQEELTSSGAGRQFSNLIYMGFYQGTVGKRLPTFEIEAAISAQLFFDKMRKYKPNDMHDINHAIAALPYCDYFFTEKNLREFIIKKNLGYDRKYNCGVVSAIEEAISVVQRICR